MVEYWKAFMILKGEFMGETNAVFGKELLKH